MLAVELGAELVLVDCGGDAAQRLLSHGLSPRSLSALILTHEHADHVAGFPLLLERMWLEGRREPLDVYGIERAVSQAKRVHDSFDVSAWPGYPELRYHTVPCREGALVLETGSLRVTATPGEHAVPCVGLRFEDLDDGGVLAYSGDTAYQSAIVRMARGADLLVHEATDEPPMHSRPEEAGRVAREAGVQQLVLVHLPPGFDEGDGLLRAQAVFANTSAGVDGARVSF